MAHPVRPDEYLEINNFYTATVYEKGAEVIRMQHTLLGPERFRRGMDLYFERHDGQAVTCDDFVQAMQDATQRRRTSAQFRRWYSQAGTPVVDRDRVVTMRRRRTYTLDVAQRTPPTPGQPDQGAVAHSAGRRSRRAGRHATCRSRSTARRRRHRHHARARLCAERQQFVPFRRRCRCSPVPSLLRGFSAPVRARVRLHARTSSRSSPRTTAMPSTAGTRRSAASPMRFSPSRATHARGEPLATARCRSDVVPRRSARRSRAAIRRCSRWR